MAPEKIRIYGGAAVALATPGYTFNLKIERKSCTEPIVWPLVTAHSKETPVQWFTPETDPPALVSEVLGHTVFWQTSKAFCESRGMKLCSYENVCPYGKDTVVAGDPFGQAYNDVGDADFWVAIESGPHCPGKWRMLFVVSVRKIVF